MLNPEILSKVLTDATNPDKAPEALLLLKDEAEQLFAKYDEAQKSIAGMTEKVAELRDTSGFSCARQALRKRTTNLMSLKHLRRQCPHS